LTNLLIQKRNVLKHLACAVVAYLAIPMQVRNLIQNLVNLFRNLNNVNVVVKNSPPKRLILCRLSGGKLNSTHYEASIIHYIRAQRLCLRLSCTLLFI